MKKIKNYMHNKLIIIFLCTYPFILSAQNSNGIIAYVDTFIAYTETDIYKARANQLNQIKNNRHIKWIYFEAEMKRLSENLSSISDSNSLAYHEIMADIELLNLEMESYDRDYVIKYKQIDSDSYALFDRNLEIVLNEMYQEINLTGVYYRLEDIPPGTQYHDMTNTVIKAINTMR